MKRKTMSVEFDDGVYDLPSSMKAKCTVTGREIHYYTPNLLRIIRNKYKNNYSYFLDNYVSREGKALAPEVVDDEEEDLTPYREYLLMFYRSLIQSPASSDRQNKMADIVETYGKRFPDRNFKTDYEALI